ncbi:MAG: terminase family protein, partial [Pseudomonadota bacterium]
MAQNVDPALSFYPYQSDWLNDDSRFKIGMMSRQIGKTFTTGAEVVKDCIDAEIAGTRTRWVILSRGERQAKEMMDEVIKPMTKAFFGAYNVLLKGGEPEFEENEFRVSKAGEEDAV